MQSLKAALCFSLLYYTYIQAESSLGPNNAPTTAEFGQQQFPEEELKRLKAKCEATSDNGDTYFDENWQRCILKVSLKENTEQFMDDGTWTCPKHARGSWGMGTTSCRCDESYIHTLDGKECLSRKGYEDPCIVREDEFAVKNPELYGSNCDNSRGLRCQNGFCSCNNTDAIWNSVDQQCYSGPDCTRLNYQSYYDPKSQNCLYKLRDFIYEDRVYGNSFIKCPINSQKKDTRNTRRNSGYICDCVFGYAASNDNLRCEPVKMPGEICESSNNNDNSSIVPCNSNAGLSCVNGKCECTGKHTWEIRESDCRMPTGSKCNEGNGTRPCGKHATCPPTSRYSQSSYCQCKSGYGRRFNFCYGRHHSECSEPSDCDPQFTCMNGKCECKEPMNQFEIDGTCYIRVGNTCNVNERGAGTACTRYAICINNTCICIPDYSPTSDGTNCLMDFGTNCNRRQSACNYEQGLACINETCVCAGNNLEYIPGEGCVGNLGDVCGNMATVGECGDKKCTEDHVGNYFVGCKSPQVCSDKISGEISRCLLPGENIKSWTKQIGALTKGIDRKDFPFEAFHY